MFKAAKSRALLVLALLLGSCSGSGDSHYVDDIASGANIYASTDMRPLKVNFVDVRNPERPAFTATLPRAYVIAFDPYTSRSYGGEEAYDALPDEISGNGPLWVAYLHPKGQPYTRSSGDLSEQETGPADSSFGNGYGELKRGEHRRWLTGHAKIFQLHQQWIDEGYTTTRALLACWPGNRCGTGAPSGEAAGSFDGFTVYRTAGSKMHYVDAGSDEIREIACFGEPDQRHRMFFCDYYFPLNDRLLAQLTFLDFRMHGGRAFARSRIRAFKQTFCGFLDCDQRALAATGIQ